METKFDLDDYQIVAPFIALAEQAEGQRMMNTLEETVQQQAQTSTGMGGDYDLPARPPQQTPPVPPPNQALSRQR
jgi:hypothetical protein